jgi:hypothetical protein
VATRPKWSLKVRAVVVAAVFSAAVVNPCAAAQAGGQGETSASEVQVLTGGVGEGERARLAEQARDYNLKLVFTMSTGNYIAEVPFQISRAGKTIVDEASKGPWAFVKLPPGKYTVKATYNDKTQTKDVTVAKTGQKRLSLVWPATARVAEQPQPTR